MLCLIFHEVRSVVVSNRGFSLSMDAMRGMKGFPGVEGYHGRFRGKRHAQFEIRTALTLNLEDQDPDLRYTCWTRTAR